MDILVNKQHPTQIIMIIIVLLIISKLIIIIKELIEHHLVLKDKKDIPSATIEEPSVAIGDGNYFL